MVDAAVKVAPLCSCGARMSELPTAGFFACEHCDGPCHKRCADECDRGVHDKCANCNAFDIGSRPKRDWGWHPPKAKP